ncbi:hypothetical protein [Nocardia testacea]|uniref:WXG100 family type VII secretion target n=1 Tax=Nocardia testacea TaxID=248551 RepID=A0ABW7W4M6_9NOCA
MARDLQTDIDLLEATSKCWLTEAGPQLREAAQSIDDLKYTQVQFGALFIGAWQSYSKAAVHIQDLLNQAGGAADQMGNALHATAVSFADQESQNQQALNNVAGEMGS